MPNIAKVRISKERLSDILFPVGTRIHYAIEPSDVWNPSWIELVVEHRSLPPLREGDQMPTRIVVHEKNERRFE